MLVTTRTLHVATVQVVECTNNCASPKKKSLNLIQRWKGKESCADGSGNKDNDARFQFLTMEEFSELQEGYKSVSTVKCTQWALNFEAWRGARAKAQKEKSPEDILMSTDSGMLCTWLSWYVAETLPVAHRFTPTHDTVNPFILPLLQQQCLIMLWRRQSYMNPDPWPP